MNRLNTLPLGGVPFDWDDWKWEQDGVREAFFGLLSSWGIAVADGFILSGCNVTLNGLNFDIAAGFIALEGEIYKVDAHSVLVALPGGFNHHWIPVVTFDPAGLEATKNLGNANTYEIRRAKVVNAMIPVLGFTPMFAPTIHQKIADNVKPFFGDWTRVDLSGSTDVKQNSQTDGLGISSPLVTAPDGNSYYKYNIVGKVCTLVFRIDGIRTTTHDVLVAGAINLINLPFTAKDKAQVVYFAENTNHQNGLSGVHPVFINNGSNQLIFNLNAPHEASRAIFNREYFFNGSTDMSIGATGLTSYEADWSLSGEIVFEIN